jgi:glutamate-1-semialdehyde 2,1-aminomutase
MMIYVLIVLALILGSRWLYLRLLLSRAKHPSLTGHARLARRLAGLIPHYEYDATQFFAADGAPEEVQVQRRAGFARLAALYAQRFATTAAATAEA